MGKTIQIDADALTTFLIDTCPLSTLSDSGTRYCEKKIQEECTLYLIERDRCPRDCPRLYYKGTKCDEAQCNRILKQIKKLKA